MIIDIPTRDEFEKSALDLMNTAWSQVSELLIEFNELIPLIEGSLRNDVMPEIRPDGNNWISYASDESITRNTEAYWKASRQTMLIALTLVQQAVEFFIKGRLVSISSHLLIDLSVSTLPKQCTQEDTSFSSFKTIDAQDLIKIHDTVYPDRFDDGFKTWYTNMRTLRNKIIHIVANEIQVSPEKILEDILYIQQYFMPSSDWSRERIAYLLSTPDNSIDFIHNDAEFVHQHIMTQLHRELKAIIEKLQPSVVKKYLGYDKTRHALHCPSCYKILSSYYYFDPDNEEPIKTFQTISRTSDEYKCFVCGLNRRMIFHEKSCEECGERLINPDDGICLACGYVNNTEQD